MGIISEGVVILPSDLKIVMSSLPEPIILHIMQLKFSLIMTFRHHLDIIGNPPVFFKKYTGNYC